MSERSASATRELTAPRWAVPALDVPAIGSWALPFAVILLLAFSGGGYDPIVRGQAGIVAWWMVLVGAAFGTVRLRGGWPARVAVALFGAFVLWTAAGLSWTESTERTVGEIARVAMLLGVLILGLASQGRVAARHAVNGAACAITVVAAIAVLSRLQPQLFGASQLDAIFPTSRSRLAYPLGYWNLLAGLTVMGVPLLLAAAGAARTNLARGAATAALPIFGLCVFLTNSRGGLLAAVVVVVVFLLLAPDRVPKLVQAALGGGGAVLLSLAADRRDALQAGLGDALARQQGDQLLGLGLLVCVGVGLVAVGVSLADRHATRPGWSRPSRRVAGALSLVVLIVGVGAAIATGVPGKVDDRVQEFKSPVVTALPAGADNAVARLSALGGNGRYAYWQSAERANATAPLEGIGPGTFEFWWARNGVKAGGFVRNAHSLWFETFAETGLVGLLLVGGFFLLVVVVGGVRALRAADPEHRIALAAATAGVAGFAATASLEWAWQMTVLPAAALLLAAVALAGRAEAPLQARPSEAEPPPRRAARVPLIAVALVALVAIGIPTAAASDLRESQREATDGNLQAAIDQARSGAGLQPYSASLELQQALILERAGQLAAGLTQAVRATEEEPTNWRTWLVRSRLEARSGNATAAVRSYEKARSLNPRSPIFAR